MVEELKIPSMTQLRELHRPALRRREVGSKDDSVRFKCLVEIREQRSDVLTDGIDE